MKILFLLPLLFISVTVTLAQTLRGSVLDAQSGRPLPGATLRLTGADSTHGTTTDAAGLFRLPLPGTGRYAIRVSYVGYDTQTTTPMLVSAGKEASTVITLSESVIQQAAIVVRAGRDRLANEFGLLSARPFDVEQTRRFAGSRNDPARMAAAFAGVLSNNDARNDIVIRGNSPLGLLWRLDGVDIPNPSHFGSLGSTGGPVTMVNNNTLARSDFFTGAFPATYGNAQSGVFDLALRTGNATKREWTGQIGFNGVELGAEGPFVVGGRGTYLIHYRYSVLTLIKKLGISTGTGSAVPGYQDLTVKIDLPVGRPGNRFSLFALGGRSEIQLLSEPNGGTNFYNTNRENTVNRAGMGVVGGSYTHFLDDNTSVKLTLARTYATYSVVQDTLNPSGLAVPYYRDQSGQGRWTAVSQMTRKLNARHTLAGGLTLSRLDYAFADSVFRDQRAWRTLRNEQGNTALMQAYVQWQYRPTDRLTLNTGLHSDWFGRNSAHTLEPRLSGQYALPHRQTVSLAVGLHSQLPPLQLLAVSTLQEKNGYVETNRALSFMRSAQAVLGYGRTVGDNLKLKAEAYGQWLYDVPVEQRPSPWSALNLTGSQSAPSQDSLVNAGRGQNLGLELTAERAFANGYYFLTTVSLYDSRYQGSDGVWRNTVFNGHYILNTLAGYEFRLGNRRTLAFDTRLTVAGGRRYTPVDLAASVSQQRAVLLEGQTNETSYPAYFRTDLKITFRQNGKRITQEWFLDVQNVFNTQNPYNLLVDLSGKGRLLYQTQLGLYPVFNWRIDF
jgi:hypothetical protein